VRAGPRLRRISGIRAGEGAVVGHVAAMFALLEVGRGLGEVGVNTLVLDRLAADALPWLYIPLGLLLMVIAVSYGAAIGRVRRARLAAITLVGIGLVLVVEWTLLAVRPEAVAVAWLTVTAAGTIGFTIAWTTAGTALDARQAKRLFPICTAAAIAGYFVGGLTAGPLAAGVGVPALVLLEAICLAGAAAVILRLPTVSAAPGWTPPIGPRRPILADIGTGYDEVRRSPLLRLIAVAYVLLAILVSFVSFPYLRAAVAAFPDETELARVLGLVGAIVTAGSFVLSLTIANRFYARLGIAAAALTLPLVYVAGFLLWIVRFTFPTAAVFVVAQQVTQRGLSNAAWSAFYNVVPAGRRAQVMAFEDGVPGQIGTVLSGILLIAQGRLLLPEHVFWLGLATAGACTVVVIAIRRRYADALLRTLRSGTGEQILEGGPGLGDTLALPDVRAALIRALATDEPATRVMAASLLARSDARDAREAIHGLLDDPDPAVAGTAVESTLAAPGAAAGASGDPLAARAEARLGALLRGDEPARVVGLRVLERIGRDLPAAERVACLSHPSAAVRAMTLTVLRGSSDPSAPDILVTGLGDASPLVRRAAAGALATRDPLDPRVSELLIRGSEDEQEAALLALHRHGQSVHDRVVDWATGRVDRAIGLSDARSALAGRDEYDSDTRMFLIDILDQRIDHHRTLALSAMAILGAPATSGVIRRSLDSRDADVRAQAIEALDSIGDRRLGSAIARLVEHEPSADGRDVDTVVRRLRDDDDPWIGGLARLVEVDEEPMAERTAPTAIETMLQLRRVPLFARLTPEDLQRVAMVAVERSFAPGEVLIREGEPGTEMFVLLEGRVVVTRSLPDGSERTIRTYEAGDHIGELAVLRERPRAATVTAHAGPVRALSIDGPGLTAILRERPDAAMAMLATLAERISTQ
jgi:HEAT repeat protein